MDIHIEKSFWNSVEKLKNDALRGKVLGTISQFMTCKGQLPKGLNFEKLQGCEETGMSSLRVDRGYRIILCWVEKLEKYVFLYVGEHDPAYAVARRKRVIVNEEMTSLQTFDVPDEETSPLEEGLFPKNKYSDGSLRKLGAPEELLPEIRAISGEDQLLEKEGAFPPEVLERLLDLASGVPLRELQDEAERNKLEANGDVMKNPDTLRSFYVPSFAGQEMQEALNDLNQWRIFLHPTQRRLVHERFPGPALVLGGAGTGKTITAVHRAKELAARMSAEKTDGKILYTFFNTSLIGDVTNRLKALCTPGELRRIDIQNVDKLLTQLTKLPGYEKVRILYSGDRQYAKLWEDAAAIGDPEQTRPAGFYRKEWERIIVPKETFTLEEYLAVSRVGGEKPLSPKQRRAVWKVFEAYQRLMQERGLVDDKTAFWKYRQAIAQQPEPMYRHIIVDETQDISAGALRLLRAMAGPQREDDLFLVGDPRQKIYDRRVSLADCGIKVQGRVRRLYLNYRTTHELHRSAVRVLEGETFDDLNGEIDLDIRYRSFLSGALPQVRSCSDAEEEARWIQEEIKKLKDSGVPEQDICLTAYSRGAVKEYIERFDNSGIRTYELKQKGDDRAMEGVRVGTMHRVKGLEFQFMFIAGINKGEFPPPPKDKQERELERECKCLLYVALTRAQKGAYISGFGKTKSEFLEALEKAGS